MQSTHTISCGCARIDSISTHKLTKSPEYKSWNSMKNRCLNPNNHNYGLYGGRGITVDQTWVHSFETFLKDLGVRPSKLHTLDRIDVEGSYSPNNCRWALPTEQSNNRRDNVRAAFNGKSLTYAQHVLGIDRSLFRYHFTRGHLTHLSSLLHET